MTLAFLLRFQEQCEEVVEATGSTGTQTVTKVAQEQGDADPTHSSFRLLPVAQCNVGTVTGTRVRNEQSDADYSSAEKAIPYQSLLGTITKTAVKTEGDDQDARQHDHRAIPRCS